MLARRVIGGLALLISLAGPLAATAADDPPGATSCPGCHAVSAAVEMPVPALSQWAVVRNPSHKRLSASPRPTGGFDPKATFAMNGRRQVTIRSKSSLGTASEARSPAYALASATPGRMLLFTK
jgi:hypothetical protein